MRMEKKVVRFDQHRFEAGRTLTWVARHFLSIYAVAPGPDPVDHVATSWYHFDEVHRAREPGCSLFLKCKPELLT